jgi:uncharacterized protein YdaU (DUF1376 family)
MSKENNKRPSFQFYPKDYLSDPNVMAMSPLERGAYWHLLATMWTTEDCSLPNDEEVLAKIAQVDKVVIRSLLHCYKVVNGRLRHKRLDEERLKQDMYRNECSKAGKKGMSNRWKSKRASRSHKVDITNDNPSSSSSIASSTLIKSHNEIKQSFGNEEINNLLIILKQKIGIEDFSDTQKWQRIYATHLLNLGKKIGKEQFGERLQFLLGDDFQSKRINSIKVLYQQMKGYIQQNNNHFKKIT